MILKAIATLFKFVQGACSILFAPVRLIARMGFVLVLVNLYKLYLLLRLRLNVVWRPAKNKLLFPLSTRYVVHAVIIILTVFVTTNSLKAREIRQGESFHPSLLSSLISNEENDEIVESGFGLLTDTHYDGGIGGVSPLDIIEASDTSEVAATQESSSLMKPSLAVTTVADRPREDVVRHIVEGGETIGTIAERYSISINTIRWENKFSATDYIIKPGQQLTILPVTGVSHRVQSGETVASIVKKYEANEDQVIEYNKLPSGAAISAGQVLIIPNGQIAPPPAPTPTVRFASGATGTASTDGGTPPASARPSGKGLQWPTTSRRINQYFTYRHTGIDIDGEYSSPIYAADGGRVVFVGWGGGYGLHIIVDHGNGMETLYGHASKTFVKNGQFVERGQTMAMQGSTGWSTGVHLHFEVRMNGRRGNPFSYL